jgi:hypothetical protein
MGSDPLEVIIEGCNGKQPLRYYLRDQLVALWREGECFSGKRPLGNSGWEFDVYRDLIKSGHIEGKLDEDGYVDELDTRQAEDFIISLIEKVFQRN